MDARELRIGNLLYSNLTEKWFEIEAEDIINIFIEPENISAIPLTEEWLLKFGFEKHRPEDWQGWFQKFYIAKLHDQGCLMLYNIYSGACILTHERCDPDKTDFIIAQVQGFIAYKLIHVHSIQNLYFALTGE